MTNPRCNECGRFIGYKDKEAQVYTPFGGYLDLEPPDERYICGHCFSKMSESRWALINRISWIKPQKWLQV